MYAGIELSATAPQAIWGLYGTVTVGGKVMSGIVGDVAHSFGYHLCRNDLPADDYSVVLPLDRLGDAGSASALDIKLGPAEMITVTNRLLTAAKAHDPRLYALREFCGTTDGLNTHPYDLSNGQEGPLNSWDSSHLWHVHFSFYRAYANDAAALAPIAAVVNGEAATPNYPISTADQEDPVIIVAAPKRGIATLVPGGKYHLSPPEWAAHKAVAAAQPKAYALANISTAQWDALPDKRGKL